MVDNPPCSFCVHRRTQKGMTTPKKTVVLLIDRAIMAYPWSNYVPQWDFVSIFMYIATEFFNVYDKLSTNA